MAKYVIPATSAERLNEINSHIDLFRSKHEEFFLKEKKSVGNSARKSLLIISKLTKEIRKDIMDNIAKFSTKEAK